MTSLRSLLVILLLFILLLLAVLVGLACLCGVVIAIVLIFRKNKKPAASADANME